MTTSVFKGTLGLCVATLAFALLAGCGGNGGESSEGDMNDNSITGANGTGGLPGDSAADVDDGGTKACRDGDRVPCGCEGGETGFRVCEGGEYGAACTACTQVARPASACSAGRYVGQISMDNYFPLAASACALVPLFGGTDIRADYGFTLESKAGLDEFSTITESVSCLELVVTQVETGEPDAGGRIGGGWRGALSGGVDCETGQLEGMIRLAYYSGSVCDPEERWWSVKGRMTGTWNEAAQAFEGVFDLQEPATLLGGLLQMPSGGRGTFWARLDPDAEDPEPVEDCLDGAEWTDFELIP